MNTKLKAGARRQHGIALITALLVVALAASAAAAMLSGQYLAIRRTQNVLAAGQAWQYALAAETVAISLLARDRDSNRTDGAGDPWQGILPPVSEGGATIQVRITDLQGRLNVNALGSGDQQRGKRVAGILARLLDNTESHAPAIAAAAADWIDGDLQPRFPDGAEDDFYTRRKPPYRTPNAAMAGASEMRLLRGIDGEPLGEIRDLVTALPDNASGINLNTASPRLLRALHPAISESDVRHLVTARRDRAFSSVADALREVPGFAQPELPREWLRVDSEYFLVTGTVDLGRVHKTLHCVLHRPAFGPIQVLYRGAALP